MICIARLRRCGQVLHSACLSWMHDLLCSSRSALLQTECGSLVQAQALQTGQATNFDALEGCLTC